MKSKIYYGEYSLYHWMQLVLKQNIVLPDYQRLFVWDKEKTNKLIESFNGNEFVPPITIGSYDSHEGRENLIIDGQQRLTSILLSYLGIFPNKDKYKKIIQTLADENDMDSEDSEYDNILEWSFKELTKKGKNKEKILSNIIHGNYDTIDVVNEEFLKSHYLGFAYLVPQRENDETEKEFYTEQQRYYSTVFRNINIQGEDLLPQESRKSLYFLKKIFDKFFEPQFTNKVKVNDSKMDFVRYVALVSHWRKKSNINKVGYGYARKMEKLYEEFIYFVVDGKNEHNFEVLPDYVMNGEYSERLEHIAEIFQIISREIQFNSIQLLI